MLFIHMLLYAFAVAAIIACLRYAPAALCLRALLYFRCFEAADAIIAAMAAIRVMARGGAPQMPRVTPACDMPCLPYLMLPLMPRLLATCAMLRRYGAASQLCRAATR